MMGRGIFLSLAGFTLGVFVRSFYVLPWEVSGFVFVATFIFFGAWFFVRPRRRAYLFFAVVFLSVFIGVVRVSFTPLSLPGTFSKMLGTDVTLDGTIAGAPSVRDTSQRVIVKVSHGNETTRVLAVVSLATDISYGERVRLRGKIETPKSFDTEYGRTFRYDRYLAVEHVFAIMPHATLVETAPASGMLDRTYGVLISVKNIFLRALTEALPEPEASLAGGIVAGGTQGLGKNLLSDFVRSGLIHVVVLSGYNVMIVAEAVLFALAFLKRKWATGIAGLVIGAFVISAGAGASSIRAGIMAWIALSALATGRTYEVTRALAVTVFVMLLWNPLLLAFSFGFDLSVVATVGLIFGVPLIVPKLLFVKSEFLRETIASTISAQLAVLPLLLYVNGLFSIVALPANVLVLPLVPLAMATSAVAGVVALFSHTFAPVVGLPAYILLKYIIWIVHYSATLPFSAFAVPVFSFRWVVGSYGVLAFLVWRLVLRKKTLALLPPQIL
ncbi:MAG TPA: ComEC family competence protein [Candidatus Kaiserbacteria bacterium]|nr:ComEC family competence protein [Candidatus Kaiserbacteria bacterium]